MQRLALAGFTGLLAAIGGYTACPVDAECTLEARPSVIVKIMQNVDGRLLPTGADEVKFVVNPHPSTDGPRAAPQEQDAECRDDACTEWIAGREVEGEISVTATVCGSSFSEVALVEMTEDECHVDTQTLVLEVDRSACEGPEIAAVPSEPKCTMDLRPSFVVNTHRRLDDMVIPTRPASLNYWPVGPRRAIPMQCADAACSVHYGPWEQTGGFVVEASYCGTTLQETINVPMTADGCHVDTQDVSFLFDRFSPGCIHPGPPPSSDPRPIPRPTDLTAPPQSPPDDLDATCIAESQRDPAFVASLVRRVGDMMVPVHGTSLTFATEDDPRGKWKATCLDEDCSRWIAPNRGASEYMLTATVCGVETQHAIEVAGDKDGCGLITEYPYIEVDTRGCVTAEPEEVGPPVRPTWLAPAPPAPDGPAIAPAP